MASAEEAGEPSPCVPSGAEPSCGRGRERFPRGLVFRLFVYLVAGHLFAGFLWLLFYLGGTNQ